VGLELKQSHWLLTILRAETHIAPIADAGTLGTVDVAQLRRFDMWQARMSVEAAQLRRLSTPRRTTHS
jgi:hypothetical protein